MSQGRWRPTRPVVEDASSRAKTGLWFGLLCYGMWGVFPLYFPLLLPSNAIEILAHRVVWVLVVCTLALAFTRKLRSVYLAVRQPGVGWKLAAAAAIIAINWTTYAYAVNSGQVVQSSLGYFINPLMTVLLAVVVLRERLRGMQWVAVAVAACAVVDLAFAYGRFPWISLVLATSFAFYGLLKNLVGQKISALGSMTVETLVIAPLALIYVWWSQATGHAAFGHHGWGHTWAMVALGVITAVPLILFGAAASRLPLSTLGLMQYMAPVFQFLIGILVFREHMSGAKWSGVILVWVALGILIIDGVRHHRSRQGQTAMDTAEAH